MTTSDRRQPPPRDQKRKVRPSPVKKRGPAAPTPGRVANAKPARGTKASAKRARPTSAPPRGGSENRGEASGPAEPMRIAKAMAHAGLCSRRDGERWIAEGRVKVNGKVLTSPAVTVGPKDRITVDGEPLPAREPARLWRYHKPKGQVTTHRDPEGRPTVFDNLPEDMPRVISIGRLDFNTEGLLLLTTDGALARHLELPATGWLRKYRVRAHGSISQARLDTLKDGIELDGVRYGPIEARIDSVQATNTWLSIGLREGKNREVRKVMQHLGLTVNRLIRVSFGPFQLLDLEPGTVDHIRRKVLADQLGPTLAAEFGLTATEGDDDPAPAATGRPDRDAPRRSARSRPPGSGSADHRKPSAGSKRR